MAVSVAAEPRITEIPPTTMAVVRTTGDPHTVAPSACGALFASVSAVGGPRGALRARWPDAHLVSRDRWSGIWAVPIPAGTTGLPQVVPGFAVELETWDYGTVAEIVHAGPYETELASIRVLQDYVESRGYAIAGPHEEEYLTPPGAAEQRTVIRYPVVPASG